jgi:DNA-binding transcriptional LysR family regulator
MELSDLRVFRAVARTGGITHAAKQLNRVQSNVTTRIQKLEEKLGVSLFLREGKKLQLSPAGRTLLVYADEMLALAERAREAIHATKPSGTLRLGTMESTAAARLPLPLSAYHERYPDVAIELQTGSPREQIAQVLAGELDAALVAEPVCDGRLETLPVFDEELVIIGSIRHPPIRSPHDIRVRTALAFHPGCPHRTRLESWFARGGVAIERIVELTSYHAMLGCAAAGMGIALMPLSVLETYSERSRLSIHPLADPEFGRARTLLVWRKDAPQSKVQCLAELLAAHLSPHRRGDNSICASTDELSSPTQA